MRLRCTLVRVATGSGRQIATGSYEDHDRSFSQAARTQQGILSQLDHDRCLCRDGSENAAYRSSCSQVPNLSSSEKRD
ncbi:hypothetical protein Taro_042380 [Colocasia esculenta]|uniref:Uncharacterized protein n=1 Tax=Colocasia esculenta TaxID=4460 RepID=A0A843WPF5_COLES|nr:hypothetical protein [Colocasia esculenta]